MAAPMLSHIHGVKPQNFAKWPPRRLGGLLAKDGGLADADQ